MAPGATGPVGPPYSEKPGHAVRAVVFTLPMDAQFRDEVALLIAEVRGASAAVLRPVRPGSSAKVSSVAKQTGLAAA